MLHRNAVYKRGLCCRPVSVRLSVTLVYCIHTAEDIVKLLSGSGSAIILVFDPCSDDTQVRGESLQRATNTRRWEKLRFSTYHGKVNLSDFERRNSRVKFFRRISLIALVPFDIQRWNSAVLNVERDVFHLRPYRNGAGPSAPQFLWFPFIYAYIFWRRTIPNLTWWHVSK